MPSNPLVHLCTCECGFCCCRGYKPELTITLDPLNPCAGGPIEGTYSINEAFYCTVGNGGPFQGPCVWTIRKGAGEYPVAQIMYLPAAYYPLMDDVGRWIVGVNGDAEGAAAFVTEPEFPITLQCQLDEEAGKYTLSGEVVLYGIGDCGGPNNEAVVTVW